MSIVQLTEAVVELVKADMGVALLARWAIRRELADGSLVGIAVTAEGTRRQWKAVTRATACDDSHMHAFIAQLRESLEAKDRPPFALIRGQSRKRTSVNRR